MRMSWVLLRLCGCFDVSEAQPPTNFGRIASCSFAERHVVHLRGLWGVDLERRLVLHSFLHTRLVCVGLARLARPCRTQVRLSLGARGHVRGATVARGSLGAGRRGPWGTVRRLSSVGAGLIPDPPQPQVSRPSIAPASALTLTLTLSPSTHVALHAAAHHRRSEARRLVVRLVIGLSDWVRAWTRDR